MKTKMFNVMNSLTYFIHPEEQNIEASCFSNYIHNMEICSEIDICDVIS